MGSSQAATLTPAPPPVVPALPAGMTLDKASSLVAYMQKDIHDPMLLLMNARWRPWGPTEWAFYYDRIRLNIAYLAGAITNCRILLATDPRGTAVPDTAWVPNRWDLKHNIYMTGCKEQGNQTAQASLRTLGVQTDTERPPRESSSPTNSSTITVDPVRPPIIVKLRARPASPVEEEIDPVGLEVDREPLEEEPVTTVIHRAKAQSPATLNFSWAGGPATGTRRTRMVEEVIQYPWPAPPSADPSQDPLRELDRLVNSLD